MKILPAPILQALSADSSQFILTRRKVVPFRVKGGHFWAGISQPTSLLWRGMGSFLAHPVSSVNTKIFIKVFLFLFDL